ncbi:MAG: asparagine synthetase A [Candidatus Woesearchaeota archaeon]
MKENPLFEDDGLSFLTHVREVSKIIPIQSTILKEIVDFFQEKGFHQLMPVILSTVTDPLAPDPSAKIKKVGEIEAYGQRLKLTQSMICHKQAALISGLKKIFIISPNIRLEDEIRRETGKHLFEFSQVDFEIANGKMQDVFELMEEFLVRVITKVKEKHSDILEELGRDLRIPKPPFRRYTTKELYEKYGESWEDLVSKDSTDPVWVLDHKREFYDKEDPARPGHYLNYDLIYPEGFGEALSGGEREIDYAIIERKLKERPDIVQQFSTFFELSRRGLLIPSAGAGFGFERLLRFLTGKRHIREVQFFPRVPGEKVFM